MQRHGVPADGSVPVCAQSHAPSPSPRVCIRRRGHLDHGFMESHGHVVRVVVALPPRDSGSRRTPPTPFAASLLAFVLPLPGRTGTRIDRARHGTLRKPLPSPQNLSPSPPSVCSPRAHRGIRAATTTQSPQGPQPFPRSHRRSTGREITLTHTHPSPRTETDAMATLTVPAAVPPAAEDSEQLHKAFEGRPARRLLARARSRRTRRRRRLTRVSLLPSSQVGARTRR